MSELAALKKLELALARSKEDAASLHDDLLLYVISMAIVRVRQKRAHLGEVVEARPRRFRVVAA